MKRPSDAYLAKLPLGAQRYIRALERIVGRLEKTADGVPVTVKDKAWLPNSVVAQEVIDSLRFQPDAGGPVWGIVHQRNAEPDEEPGVWIERDQFNSMLTEPGSIGCGYDVDESYSTRKAAKAVEAT